MTRPLDAPLDEAEQAELDAFLATRPGAMAPEALDGFFCALIANRAQLRPAEWMPQALGEGELQWQDGDQMERVLALLLRKWNAIARGFRVDWTTVGEARMREEMYLPAVELSTDTADSPLARQWARGFGAALPLLPAASLRRLERDEEAVAALAVIAALDAGLDPDGEPLDHDQRKHLVARAVIGLQRLYRLSHPQATPPAPARANAKPGRNDPCPCGSGQKFKKCCGSPARLH